MYFVDDKVSAILLDIVGKMYLIIVFRLKNIVSFLLA